MNKQKPPRLYTRAGTSAYWMRWYDGGILYRRSTGTDDLVAAERILAQKVAELETDKMSPRLQVPLRFGFTLFEQGCGLKGQALRQLRRLTPLLIEALEENGVRTFEDLAWASLLNMFEWLKDVRLSGISVELGPDQTPVYEGQFGLSKGMIEQAVAFAAAALEFVAGESE